MEQMQKMNGQQSTEFMASVIPELNLRLKRPELRGDIEKILSIVVDFTTALITAENWRKVDWTMQVMGYVFNKADKQLKSGIEKYFLGAFPRFRKISGMQEWKRVEGRMPVELLLLRK